MHERLKEALDHAASVVRARTDLAPSIGLVLGSGLGAFADSFDDRVAIPFGEIPGMHGSRVAGHAGKLVLGRVRGVPVAAMQGRIHLYEGHSPDDVVFGAQLLVTLGCGSLILTNAAGGLARGMRPGDLMLIEDHVNLTGRNCLVGINDDRLGVRFVDMTVAYDAELREVALAAAAGLGLELRRGVYAGLLGPTYETPAEIRMLATLGASAVGMSTVLETIAARHMGARVLGISCITNLAAGLSGELLSHDEVKDVADRVKGDFTRLLAATLAKMGSRA